MPHLPLAARMRVRSDYCSAAGAVLLPLLLAQPLSLEPAGLQPLRNAFIASLPRSLEAVYSGDSDERVKWLVYTLEQASRIADATAGGCPTAWEGWDKGCASGPAECTELTLASRHLLTICDPKVWPCPALLSVPCPALLSVPCPALPPPSPTPQPTAR